MIHISYVVMICIHNISVKSYRCASKGAVGTVVPHRLSTYLPAVPARVIEGCRAPTGLHQRQHHAITYLVIKNNIKNLVPHRLLARHHRLSTYLPAAPTRVVARGMSGTHRPALKAASCAYLPSNTK